MTAPAHLGAGVARLPGHRLTTARQLPAVRGKRTDNGRPLGAGHAWAARTCPLDGGGDRRPTAWWGTPRLARGRAFTGHLRRPGGGAAGGGTGPPGSRRTSDTPACRVGRRQPGATPPRTPASPPVRRVAGARRPPPGVTTDRRYPVFRPRGVPMPSVPLATCDFLRAFGGVSPTLASGPRRRRVRIPADTGVRRIPNSRPAGVGRGLLVQPPALMQGSAGNRSGA